MPSATAHLAYLTGDTPGIGGVIKQRPQDFFVEEQPLYAPCGQGEHLYLFIEKCRQTTTDVARRLAKLFSVRRGAIGYAGLKDKHAVTRQHFSVHLPTRENEAKALQRVQYTNFRLLWAERHTNKLRRGHLAGNRFIIHVRQVDPSSVVRVKAVFERLEASGVPNYIGDQRFGYRHNNHVLGRLYLLRQWRAMLDELLGRFAENDPPHTVEARRLYAAGDYLEALRLWPRAFRHERQALDTLRQGRPPRDAIEAIDETQREFFLSALQSAIFNEVLNRRVTAGTFDRLLTGDLAWKHDSRAVFTVDEATAVLENGPGGRVPKLAVSPSGPMWGANLDKPTAEPLAIEEAALASFELADDDFVRSPYPLAGVRRPLRMPVANVSVAAGADEHGPYIRIGFDLPRGSFATMVLREVMKPCVDAQVAAAEAMDED